MNNQITYADKVALNQNSNIPDNNKVNASDMNEIKSVVNGVFNGDVATNDFKVGGTLYTSNAGREDYAEYGFIYDGAGNMQHKRSNSNDSFQIKANNGNPCLQIIPETSAVNVGGDVGIGGNLNIGGVLSNKTMPSTNLNDVKTKATYMYDNGSNTYSNAPASDGIHILNVLNNGSGDWVVQEDYVLRWGASTVDKYIRLYTPGGWGNWQKII